MCGTHVTENDRRRIRSPHTHAKKQSPQLAHASPSYTRGESIERTLHIAHSTASNTAINNAARGHGKRTAPGVLTRSPCIPNPRRVRSTPVNTQSPLLIVHTAVRARSTDHSRRPATRPIHSRVIVHVAAALRPCLTWRRAPRHSPAPRRPGLRRPPQRRARRLGAAVPGPRTFRT